MSVNLDSIVSQDYIEKAKSYIENINSFEISESWQKWDKTVSNVIYEGFRALGFSEIYSPSIITKDRFMVSSPTPLITTIIIYLLFIVFGILFKKPKLNGDVMYKESILMKSFVFCHNVFLVILSTYMFSAVIYYGIRGKYNIWGNAYRPDDIDMINVIYIFYLSKIYEFIDTVIMILRGNIHQVTFLHVYHHATISFLWWAITYTVPGGDAIYSCALNALVHVFMYIYYLMSSVIGKDKKLRKKYLWWGKYMTQFQIMQFMSNMIQSVYCYYYSYYPPFMSAALFIYMQSLIILFVNFYIQKHFMRDDSIKKSKEQ